MNMAELVEKWQDVNDIYHFEGESGLVKLGKLFEAMGYEGHRFRYGSLIEVFLVDNPGAIEAILEWINECNFQEWVESMSEQLEYEGYDVDEDKD